MMQDLPFSTEAMLEPAGCQDTALTQAVCERSTPARDPDSTFHTYTPPSPAHAHLSPNTTNQPTRGLKKLNRENNSSYKRDSLTRFKWSDVCWIEPRNVCYIFEHFFVWNWWKKDPSQNSFGQLPTVLRIWGVLFRWFKWSALLGRKEKQFRGK